MIDFKRLRYFVAVASERSFSGAARSLHMAQPPLSKRIQEIEAELGARLFDREAKPIVLTAAGRLFYEQAIQILQRSTQMQTMMRQFVAAARRRFVIGLVRSGFHARLPQVMRRYRQLASDVDLTLNEMTSVQQVSALKDGRIDAGLSRIRIEDAGLAREVLREEPMLLALPPDHPLAHGDGAVDLLDIVETPLIIYPSEPRPSYADHILSLCRDHGVELRHIVEVLELQTALIMVAAGGGACIVPQSARILAHSDVRFREIQQLLTSPIILVHRASDRSEELMVLFRTFIDLYPEWGFPIPATLVGRLKDG